MIRRRDLETVEHPNAPKACIACKRPEGPYVVLETRVLGDGTSAQCCVNPSECRRHWPSGGFQ